MSNRIKTAWMIPNAFLWIASLYAQQSQIALHPASDDYALLTYSQHYLDTNNNAIEYNGTLYLKLESLTLTGCQAEAHVVVQDRFTGSEEKRGPIHTTRLPLREHSYTYRYSYQFDLKKTPHLQMHLVSARPYQLTENSGFTCEEDSTCRLLWLHLNTATNGGIDEMRIRNDLVDFDRSVNEIWLPMTSRETALKLQQSLQQATDTCGEKKRP